MISHESKEHHFVPKLLLRPWLVEAAENQFELHGYWWDARRGLSCKRKGLKGFCNQIDLLSLRSHSLGRDALERIFFGSIDSKGAIARDLLLENGPNRLDSQTRSDFARLLFSIEIRRPSIVKKLRMDGRAFLAEEIDADPDICQAMTEIGIELKPSEYLETRRGFHLEDRALGMIQSLIDNPNVGNRLINAHWSIKRINQNDGSLVLSDRPLIRIHGYDHPDATWALPLNPQIVFIACNSRKTMISLQEVPSGRFVKSMNRSSVFQAERFVFCSDASHEHWLEKRMKPPKKLS